MKAEIRPGYRIRLDNIELRQPFRNTLQFQVRCSVQINCFLCYNFSKYNIPSTEVWVASEEPMFPRTIELEPLYITPDKIGYHMLCLKRFFKELEQKKELIKNASSIGNPNCSSKKIK